MVISQGIDYMGVTFYSLWWAITALGLTSYISLFCKLATLDSMDGRCTILVGHLAWHGKGSDMVHGMALNGRRKFCVCKRLYLAILTIINLKGQLLAICRNYLSDDF
jgi:hypothetical protein